MSEPDSKPARQMLANAVDEALALQFLGQAQIDHDDIAEAQQSLTQALTIHVEIGDDVRAAELRSMLATLPEGTS